MPIQKKGDVRFLFCSPSLFASFGLFFKKKNLRFPFCNQIKGGKTFFFPIASLEEPPEVLFPQPKETGQKKKRKQNKITKKWENVHRYRDEYKAIA